MSGNERFILYPNNNSTVFIYYPVIFCYGGLQMKKGIIATIALSALSMTSSTFACDRLGHTGFAPENNLRIAVDDKATNGMTQERFNQIIDRVEKVYIPVAKTKGGNYKVIRNWTDETVNAYATENGSDWQVQMFGGLARHPLVTDDGFMLVVCHETGHHLGGAPKKGGFGSKWASNEGQADYFGAMKCMRRVIDHDDNAGIVANMKVDADAKTKCEMIFHNDNEIALCERIAMAGKSLAMLLGELGGNSKVAFNTPDKSVVTKTYDAHPEAQCRLDTYFSGSLCDKSWNIDVDNKKAEVGVCIKSDGHTEGIRPLCWYKPTSKEI